jgi:hypothetical protein
MAAGVGLVEVVELIEAELARHGISGCRLGRYYDPDWGCVYTVEAGLNAGEALELWLRLAKLMPYTGYGAVVGVRWPGGGDVSEGGLAGCPVEIMVESGLRSKAVKPLDVAKELGEERSKRRPGSLGNTLCRTAYS